jgi:hypothetical protein
MADASLASSSIKFSLDKAQVIVRRTTQPLLVGLRNTILGTPDVHPCFRADRPVLEGMRRDPAPVSARTSQPCSGRFARWPFRILSPPRASLGLARAAF